MLLVESSVVRLLEAMIAKKARLRADAGGSAGEKTALYHLFVDGPWTVGTIFTTTYAICCATTDVLIAKCSTNEVAVKDGQTFRALSASSSIRYAFLSIRAFCLHYRNHLRNEIFFHRLWYTVNDISWTGLCKARVSTKVDATTAFVKGPQNERRARELLFWDMYVDIYIFGQCDSDLVLAWHKSGRGIDEGGFFFFLFFKDLLHDCILTRQLLKCKHYQLSAAVSSGVVTNGLSLITVDQRTSNLSRMIIRCIQRMKQAYVHVLIFTELTLYVERSLGCFAFIKYKKGVLLFSWTQVSVLSPFCQSAPWKTQKAEIHQQLDTDLFCRVSHLTSVLDLWCVCFLMELNTRVCGGIFKKVKDDGAIYVHSFTQI